MDLELITDMCKQCVHHVYSGPSQHCGALGMAPQQYVAPRLVASSGALGLAATIAARPREDMGDACAAHARCEEAWRLIRQILDRPKLRIEAHAHLAA